MKMKIEDTVSRDINPLVFYSYTLTRYKYKEVKILPDKRQKNIVIIDISPRATRNSIFFFSTKPIVYKKKYRWSQIEQNALLKILVFTEYM